MTGRSTRLYQHGNPLCLGRCRDENTCAENDAEQARIRRELAEEAGEGKQDARPGVRFTFGDEATDE